MDPAINQHLCLYHAFNIKNTGDCCYYYYYVNIEGVGELCLYRTTLLCTTCTGEHNVDTTLVQKYVVSTLMLSQC